MITINIQVFSRIHRISRDNEATEVVTTYGQNVLCTIACDTENLSPCSQEEADTRIIFYVADAVEEGHRKILIRTVDTIVSVHYRQREASTYTLELWVAFGSGTYLRYIAAHEIARTLGKQRSWSLPLFHALTGCGTVSCFGGRGKKTAMEIWKLFLEVTDAFLALSYFQTEIGEPCMQCLESVMSF